MFTQSSIFLPANDLFTDQSTEPAGSWPLPPSTSRAAACCMLRDAVTGLAIHNLPLLRHFHPTIGEVASASFFPPFGYAIVVTDGVRTLELLGYMGGSWPPHWALRTVGRKAELRVRFPPSFVLAGSSRAELIAGDSTRIFEFDTNGYQCEWEALYESVADETKPVVSLSEVVDDMTYALDLADKVEQWMGERS